MALMVNGLDGLTLSSEPVDGFWQKKSHFGVVFQGQSMVRPLHTSADMEKYISITLDPVDGFKSVRGHFRVVFQDQSTGEVTVCIS